MPDPAPNTGESITILLSRARAGDKTAMDVVFARTYGELRDLARAHLSRAANGRVVDATELVGAACAKLLGDEELDAENRRHFFYLLGRAMHDVLVAQARAMSAAKRGGDRITETYVEVRDDGKAYTLSIRELQTALVDLERHDPDAAEVVKLRYFSGLSLQKAAETMGCTFGIARGHWDYALAWLNARIAGADDGA